MFGLKSSRKKYLLLWTWTIRWKQDELQDIWNEMEDDEFISDEERQPIGFSVSADVIMIKEL